MKQMIKKTAVILSLVMVCAPVGAMAANKLIVNATDGTTPAYVVTDTGSVGIGTSAPAAALHVKSIGGFPGNTIKIEGTPGTVGAGFLCYNNNGTTAPTNGDRFGFIYFGSTYDGAAHHPAGFAANADADWSQTSTPAYFYFATTAIGSTTRIERVRFTSSGSVGVNTTTPQATLDVNGSFRINPGNTLPTSATAITKPTCTDSNRGTFWFTQGTPDKLELCMSNGTATDWVVVK